MGQLTQAECDEHREAAIEWVLHEEGGDSNDPRDSGGETKYGISKRGHPEAWKNGPPTLRQARAIYRDFYWARVSEADELVRIDPHLALAVFQASVLNQVEAAKALQRAVGATVDGDIGPNTLACTRVIVREHYGADVVLPAFLLHWIDFLTDLAMRVPKNRAFHLGWVRRAMKLWPRP